MAKSWSQRESARIRARKAQTRVPHRLFDSPGKATGWGVVGCMLCFVFAGTGVGGALAITVITALAGCWSP